MTGKNNEQTEVLNAGQDGLAPDDSTHDTSDSTGEVEPQSPRRQSLRERANAPSDTVGTGSYAAVTCSVIALLATALLIAGLLISRWLF